MLVFITDNCVSCGACEAINPEVFSLELRPKVNQKMVNLNKKDCIDAALICPVNAIKIDDIF